ncbi:hypothetical protein LIA77_08904 [Sarocladium implicatum]|nr:hypothetical protein LIA77_08904 [Sarocladium implicatum]
MASKRSLLEWVYVVLIAAQIVGMFLNDFVPLYPAALWQEPSAPLHFLLQLRQLYYKFTGDPYVVLPPAHPWFEGCTYVELVFQLPLGAYFLYKLLSNDPIDGPAELSGLAFACFNTMGSYIICHDVWLMAPEAFAPGQQMKLIFTEFAPYAIMSAVMGIDMYMRLLGRVQQPTKTKAR